MHHHQLAFVGAVLFGCCGAAIASTVPFSGEYTQDFNGLAIWSEGDIFPLLQIEIGDGPHAIEGILGATGMIGWYGENSDGNNENTEFKAHDGNFGSSTGRGIISFGLSGSSERALGFVPTGQARPSFGVILENTSDVTYTSVQISFAGEQWRAGDPNIENLIEFFHGTGSSILDAQTLVPELTFNAPYLSGAINNAGLDGDAPANREVLSAEITGLSWGPGQTLALRWKTNELSGQDNGLAIDDLVVTGIEGGGDPADLNGDGVVDFSDLLILLSNWGACADPGDCASDLSGDGIVDFTDLLVLLSSWG